MMNADPEDLKDQYLQETDAEEGNVESVVPSDEDDLGLLDDDGVENVDSEGGTRRGRDEDDDDEDEDDDIEGGERRTHEMRSEVKLTTCQPWPAIQPVSKSHRQRRERRHAP